MYVQVLKNRQIVYYLTGAGVSQLGNVLAGLAFLFLAYELTESGMYTTGVAISQAVPYLLFGLIGGAVADRVNKKRLLILLDLVRTPIIFILVAIYYMDALSYWHLITVSFIIQSCGCFFNPAFRAILPLITSENERTTVNSLLDSVTRGAQVLGPVFSIGLLSSGHVIHFFTLDGITYLFSAIVIYKLVWKESSLIEKGEISRSGIFEAIKSFFLWAKGEDRIRTLFIVTFLMVFFNTWVWQVGLLILLMETTANGEHWYSILSGWYGTGVIIINLFIPLIWRRMSLQIYLAGSIIWGIGILILGSATHISVYFVGIFVAAIGLPIAGLARVYLIQTLVPQAKLGRGFSFNAVLLYTSNVLSLGIFGLAAAFIGTQAIFLFCGTMMVIIAAFYYFRMMRNVIGVIPYKRVNN